MATNERFMPVPPEAIWDVLAEPASYGYWVVGSKTIRDAEPEWPAPGSKFHHTIGVGPFVLSDHTVALEAERPHRFVLRAKGRPAGTATVSLELTPKDGGTVVTISENPDGVFAPLSFLPPLQLFTKVRNAESLMRLEELALRRA
ncbi:MAG: SRPBCC family protein [Solirubrobacteraceae bacterium]